MANAVINTFNNLDKTLFTTDKDTNAQVSVPGDFEMQDTGNLNFDTVLSRETGITEETTNNEGSLNIKTLGDIMDNNVVKSISEVISNTVKEIAGETALEGIITGIVETVETNIISNSTEETAQETTELAEETENTEEITNNTIINEDSTVNKENLIYPAVQESAVTLAMQTPVPNTKVQNNDIEAENDLEIELNFSNDNKQQTPAEFSPDKQQPKDVNTIVNNKTVNYIKDDEKISETKYQQKNVLDEKIVKDLNIEAVESQSAENSTSDNLMQNQSPQEQVIKAIINGDIKFDDKAIKTFATAQETVKTEVNSAKIIEQITKQLDNMHNSSKINMVLNPEKLGKLSLQIINGKDGLSAQLTVTTNEAKSLLMNGLDGLKETLLAYGVNIDNINIKLNESEKSSYNPDWTEQEGSRGGNKQGQSQKQKKEEKHFEQMMFELNNNDKV